MCIRDRYGHGHERGGTDHAAAVHEQVRLPHHRRDAGVGAVRHSAGAVIPAWIDYDGKGVVLLYFRGAGHVDLRIMPFALWQGLLIPFAGTTLGAACVFFMRNNLRELVQRALTGFAAGVMAAASIWSLSLIHISHLQGKIAKLLHVY